MQMSFFLSIFFQRDGSHGGNLYERELRMALELVMPRWGLVTYCSPLQTVCVPLRTCSLPAFCVCHLSESPERKVWKFKKLKLAESKVKSSLTQRALGAAVQDVTDSQAQPWPSGAAARVPMKAPFWNSSALMAYMSRKLA